MLNCRWGPCLTLSILGLLFWLGLPAGIGQAPGPAEPKPKAVDSTKAPVSPADRPTKPLPRGIEAMKLPSGSILVICKEVKEGLDLVPGAYVLAPEKYREIMDRLDKFEKLALVPKTSLPSACKLTGQVTDDLVRFQARFAFNTDKPGALVALGCQRALPTAASLDGHLPQLLPSEDGRLVVQVDAPGKHELTLELSLRLTVKGTKGGERGFDLGLPRAAITNLEQFIFAGAVPEVRINGRAVRTKSQNPGQSKLEEVPLGAADRLEMSWKAPATSAQKVTPLLSAKAQIAVQVEESRVTTDVDLTLQVLRGETKIWRILVPPQTVADIKDDRVEGVDPPDDKTPVLTIRLKEASPEPLAVKLQVRQVRSGPRVPVGPFSVFDAFRQQGTIVIAAPTNLRLRYEPHGEVSQRDVPDEKRLVNSVASFVYWNLPAPTIPTQRAPTPLDIEVETVRGAVEVRAAHELRFEPDLGWRIASKFEVKPVYTSVEHIEIELPSAYRYDDSVGVTPTEMAEPLEIKELSPGKRVAIIKLIQKQRAEFSLTVPGIVPLQGAEQTPIELPRLLQTLDRGGQVTATLPEGLEFIGRESGPEGPAPGSRKHTWRRVPKRLDLSWRQRRQELTVEAAVDVTLDRRRAFVRHRLLYQFPQEPASQVFLQVPSVLADRLHITRGGVLGPNGLVTLTSPVGKEHLLVLDYSVPLEAQVLQASLVHPLQVSRVDTKVRVWADPGTQVSLGEGKWEELPTEVSQDHDSLPALVLRSGQDIPLSLRTAKSDWQAGPPAVIQRALIQVSLDGGDKQRYHARFLISQLNTRRLELELPGSPGSLNVQAFLQDSGKRMRLKSKELPAREESAKTVVVLDVEPQLYRGPMLLDVRYEIVRESGRWLSRWRTSLAPPVIVGSVHMERVFWRVDLPDGWQALDTEMGPSAGQKWVWEGGLLKPRPSMTAVDLERWLQVTDTPDPDKEFSDPGLVCRRSSLEAVFLIHVPGQFWLLTCSVITLALGLGFIYVPWPRALLWACLVLLCLLVLGVAVFWPSMVPALIYGAEPGVLVFVVILGFQWTLRQRYRRRVVFLPGFTRLKQGSSLTRAPALANKPRQPSTVDAPPATPWGEGREGGEGGKPAAANDQNSDGRGV